MLANWPLIALRIAESIVFFAVMIGSIVAVIVPIVVSAGLWRPDLEHERDPGTAFVDLALAHWLLIVYILLIVSVVLLLLIGIHSFVEAGCARIFVNAEHAAGNAPVGREPFRAFDINQWMQGGWHSWWSVFWIYNLAWSLGGLVLLVPLLGTLALMMVFGDTGPRVAAGCIGLVISFLVMIPVAVVMGLWTQKAIAITVARGAGAGAALRLGWNEIMADLGRHLGVAVIVFVVAFGGAMAISMVTFPLSLAHQQSAFSGLMLAPAQLVVSFVQAVFSSAVGLWFLASYVGLTEERT